MRLPRHLYVGYNLLKKSRVSSKNECDDEALGYFQSVLNEAQPKTQEELVLHKFVKGMYNENRYKFLNFIKNTTLECLVLWTDSRAIVKSLGLRGVVYLKWSNQEKLFDVSVYTQHPKLNRSDTLCNRSLPSEKKESSNELEETLPRLPLVRSESVGVVACETENVSKLWSDVVSADEDGESGSEP